jgi:transposase
MLPLADYEPPDELDRQIFDRLVPQDHYLRRVLAVVDFERCRDRLASCYSVDQGRPAKEPTLLLKLEFLQYHYNLSDREVVEQARYNMAFRCFLGLSLKSSLPHHTLLTVFRERLGVEKHQAVFDDLVAQARERGLVKDRLRLKDATHMIANIAIPSAIGLVAEARQRLLAAVSPYASERVRQEEAHAAIIHTTTEDLAGAERLLQRVTHLRCILTWVDDLVAAGPPAQGSTGNWQALLQAIALARKVVTDREQPDPKDRLVSLQDPDARWGNHHGLYQGYQLDVLQDADSGLVTAINVLPANGDEARDATTLIEREQQAHGNGVDALSIDGIGFNGPLLREWTDPEGLNLEVIVPPPKVEPTTNYFTADQFTLNEAGDELTCPAGQTTRQRERNRHDTGWLFRFARRACAACPLQKQCLEKLPHQRGRTVTTNDYAAEYRAARAKVETEIYQETRRQHWRIERTLGEMVRWHHARHARYRGQSKSLVQGLLTGLVVNAKRLVKLLAGLGGTAAGTVRADLAGAGTQG